LNLSSDAETFLPQKIIKRFDHVGIAVRDVDETLKVYRDVLGGRLSVYKELGTTSDYTFTQVELGGQRLEFISPIEGRKDDDDSFLTRFLARHGEGLHHLTFQVADIKEATRFLTEKGMRIVDEFYEDPLWRTAFISPRSSRGVLIQLYDTTSGSRYDH